MPTIITFFFLLLITTSLTAQKTDSCQQDPSCRRNKELMLQASKQWGLSDIGINSNQRSDTIDILHYAIHLDMRDLENKTIKGFCELNIVAKIAQTQSIQLDLLQLQIDSIFYENQRINFEYNDTIIQIRFPTTLLVGKSYRLKVYYQGSPQKDGSWGGFYYKSGYAFNLGVGFSSNPHNYGRIWHPCFDNFIEKATYSFSIITNPNQTAQCNGLLLSRNVRKDQTINKWKLDQPIPTYLAAIAVSDYITIQQEHKGEYGTIPIELAAQSGDTAALLLSFEHLSSCIATYEYWYGPHRWDKVGYSLVPFGGGAMEHATNIAYPIAAANGNLSKESLMAHELGHSWWGNNVTCKTAKDMWINEGMASYSVHLFYEYVYGKKRYIDAVKKNHAATLLFAHKKEGGYRPISGVPFEYTYGRHVYDKGAVVAHNLRGYLGDSLFRIALQAVQENYQFGSINSIEFRDALTQASGVDLTYFFNDWVFSGGYPHFSIQKYAIKKEKENYRVNFHIQQRLLGRKTYHSNVPLAVSFLGKDWQNHTLKMNCNQESDTSILLPFEPIAIIPNKNHWLNQATIDFDIIIKNKKNIITNLGKTGIQMLEISSLKDSVYLHVSSHLVAPSLSSNYIVAENKYWTINGIFNADFEAKAQIKAPENDLILLYRNSVNSPWEKAIVTSKKDQLFVFNFQKGDYCFAKEQKNDSSIQIKSHIAEDKLVLKISSTKEERVCIKIYNSKTKLIQKRKIKINKNSRIFVFDYNKKKKGKFIYIYNKKQQLLKEITVNN